MSSLEIGLGRGVEHVWLGGQTYPAGVSEIRLGCQICLVRQEFLVIG
jgi:hypothetical protein